VDDRIMDALVGQLAGTLTPPTILQWLVAVGSDPNGPGGAYVLEVLEQLRVAVRSVRSLDAASRRWARWRAQLATEAARQRWSQVQVIGAEFVADWLLLQRAMADDIYTAERDRLEGEPRGDALVRIDRDASFGLEGALALVLDPASVSRLAPDEARAAGVALSTALNIADVMESAA
jgi:hypothetical protein